MREEKSSERREQREFESRFFREQKNGSYANSEKEKKKKKMAKFQSNISSYLTS